MPTTGPRSVSTRRPTPNGGCQHSGQLIPGHRPSTLTMHLASAVYSRRQVQFTSDTNAAGLSLSVYRHGGRCSAGHGDNLSSTNRPCGSCARREQCSRRFLCKASQSHRGNQRDSTIVARDRAAHDLAPCTPSLAPWGLPCIKDDACEMGSIAPDGEMRSSAVWLERRAGRI